MAESIGLEPMHPNRDDRLAICCITTLPTLHHNANTFSLFVYQRQQIFLILSMIL